MNPIRSIKASLLTFALCISLIPIAATTIIYYFYARSALKSRILDDLEAIAESRKRHVLSLMEKMRVRTLDFSSDGFIRNSAETIIHDGNSKQHVETRLDKYLLTNKMPLSHRLLAVTIADKSGRIVASTNKKLSGKDISGHDVFLQGINKKYGETYVDKPHYSSDLGTDSIYISAPIISRQGSVPLGVLITT